MLESIDAKKKDLTKEEFKAAYKPLIKELVVLQQEARTEGVGLVVLFEGLPFSGKGKLLSDLVYNLDARATTVYTPEQPDFSEDKAISITYETTDVQPLMSEFWNSLGERGTMTFYHAGWYHKLATKLLMEGNGKLKKAGKRMAKSLGPIESFEHQVAADGYVVVKIFCDASEKVLKKRIQIFNDAFGEQLANTGREMVERFNYKRIMKAYDRLLEATNYDFAPWTVLNTDNKREAKLAIAQTIVDALKAAIDAKKNPVEVIPAPGQSANAAPEASRFTIPEPHPTLDNVDYSLALDPEEYKVELKKLHDRLGYLQIKAYEQNVPLIVMYEGWDAAGKGGNIKRIAQGLDARAYSIFPSPAPTKPELMHPFLWRYWTRLPYAGCTGIYDRSWYGRVLVERIEGFAKPHEWQRAYDEINEFERDLVDWGAIVVKFWVEIDQDEQLNRFNARAADPDKAWKLTDEDWRNREKYPQYREAVEDMFRLTSTDFAPWTILESNDKLFARIKALRVVIAALEARLDL